MPSYPLKRDGRILHVKFENLSISLETGFLQQGNTLYREQIQVNYFHTIQVEVTALFHTS